MAQMKISISTALKTKRLAVIALGLLLAEFSTLRAHSMDSYYQYAIEFENAVEGIASSKFEFGIQLGTYEKYSRELVIHRVVKLNDTYIYLLIRVKKLSEGTEINVVSKPLPRDLVVKLNRLPTISETLTAISALKDNRSGLGPPTVYYTYDNASKKWLSAILPNVSRFHDTKEAKAIFEFFDLFSNK